MAFMTLIIDGHNLIGTGLVPGVQLGDADDEWQLAVRLRAYAVAKKLTLTVVFDNGGGPGQSSKSLRQRRAGTVRPARRRGGRCDPAVAAGQPAAGNGHSRHR